MEQVSEYANTHADDTLGEYDCSEYQRYWNGPDLATNVGFTIDLCEEQPILGVQLINSKNSVWNDR